MMESAMTRLCDTSGKMHHGILFDRCLSGPDGETKGRVMFQSMEMLMCRLHTLKVGHF